MSNETNTLIPMAGIYLDNGFNVLLSGLHGTGKTASLVELAKARGIKMKYYSCATLDPFTDLVGVPVPRQYCDKCDSVFETRTEHKEIAPKCDGTLTEHLKMIRPHDVDSAEIIFFDEFNRADSKTMNAVFEIIQFRTINGDPLPNLKACWAAMNPPDETQGYEVENLDPALLDRFDIFIEIHPKPSVEYMSKYMEAPIAKALMLWWNDHDKDITAEKKDSKADYISPRRLMKLGIVWSATKNSRSVLAALPMGGNFAKNKLTDLLKAAQKKIDDEKLGIVSIDPLEEMDFGLGDKPNPKWMYTPESIRIHSDEIANWLGNNQSAEATHDAITKCLRQGIGGEELSIRYGLVLDNLIPSMLEGMVNSFPQAKIQKMREGYSKLYADDPSAAKKLKRYHKLLAKDAKSDFPTI